jgi:non-specific serine/threonine protein kinase
VPQTVASALGVREEPGRPLSATLSDYLRSKQVLLVLDNCEHLLSACAQLADALLRACPKLCILASSREGLGITGEQTYRVPSLALPDTRRLPPLERLREFEAVQLFADRARLSQPTFAMTAENAPAIARVCQRLDGIPLAIELAAARVKTLSVEKLNERLDDRFRLLTGGSRTALPRQQTLRALIDWSYDLLSPPEQALLRRLSVFAGGCTLEAAEAVCAGDGIEAWEVLDLLTGLSEKSLLLYEEQGGEGRYRLLETMRQYARDRLLEGGEAEKVRERHRDCFLALAKEAEPRLTRPCQSAWIARLETEHDNMRAVLAWAAEPGDVTTGLRLGNALGQFWWMRDHLSEGAEQLGRLLAHEQDRRTCEGVRAQALAGLLLFFRGEMAPARAHGEEALLAARLLDDRRGIAAALRVTGGVAWKQGEFAQARSQLEECLHLWRELGDEWGAALALSWLGHVAFRTGDLPRARTCQEESLAIWRGLGDGWGIAIAFNCLAGLSAHEEDWGRARAYFEESLALARQVGVRRTLWSLWGLQRVAWRQGDYLAARSCLEEIIVIDRQRGSPRGLVHALTTLGDVSLHLGDIASAGACFRESLPICRELGTRLEIVVGLEGLAAVAVAQGQPQRAARLIGAAEALRASSSAPLPPEDRTKYDRSVAAVRTTLGEEAFAVAWTEGRALSLEDAVACAMEDVDASSIR